MELHALDKVSQSLWPMEMDGEHEVLTEMREVEGETGEASHVIPGHACEKDVAGLAESHFVLLGEPLHVLHAVEQVAFGVCKE